ncbi:nitrogenase-stabilizing/protective protein NifW [Thioalkalicoccus limnaeus]|uniref:Nitrogenase-stabilizing/protective protein NifW n=1 Tax=Thioalkalicoccus limnaeus TaxID=120681 RepID=A0ABV4BHY5_9GAMM
MTDDELEQDLSELTSAEDFLDYFGIHYEPAVVQVYRLHILQRFHDYLAEIDEMPDQAAIRWNLYAERLGWAYRDFLISDARTEKVFRVFQPRPPRSVNVTFGKLAEQRSDASQV